MEGAFLALNVCQSNDDFLPPAQADTSEQRDEVMFSDDFARAGILFREAGDRKAAADSFKEALNRIG
ncbi:hypothetical protein AGMMS50276_29220 [Synergistales bacterium]|nr:hypothetical protein AGMMS50276_29220 [Synergistales bacterium]